MKQCIPVLSLENLYRKKEPPRTGCIYPLYESYKSNYNFQNIRDSINKWSLYSENLDKCCNRALELVNVVIEHGTVQQLEMIVDHIKENIVFSLDNPGFICSYPYKETTEEQRSILNGLFNKVTDANVCSRVISNHNMISKRFNIDRYVRENAYGDSIKDTIYELCSFIDTYKMGINSKYNIALEEVLFSFYMNHIDISTREIVEGVTDYFLLNHINENDSSRELLTILEDTIKKNKFIEDTSYLTELKDSFNNSFIQENSIEAILETNFGEKTKDIINKFKSMPAKTPEAFKQLLINILVVNKDHNIVDGTKNILSIAFYFFCIVGAFSVGVYAGIFAAIVAKTVNFVMERKYMTEVLKEWYKERDAVARKIDKCKDEKKKARMEEYLKQLDKSIDSLETHSDAMRGDDEKKSYETRPSNYSNKDDDDFSFDIKFDENAKMIATDIAIIETALRSIKWDKENVEKTIFATENILNIDLKDIDYLTEFCTKYPYMISKDKFIEALEFADKEACKESGMDKYNKLNCYADNLSKLRTVKESEEFDFDLDSDDDEFNDLFADMNVIYEYTNNINSYVKCINELSLTSNLKLAVNKLSKVASNLSDKEKIMSRSVDSSCAMLSRGIEKAMTMENREAVIKGDILPSASKVIKMAIITGGAWILHPALAVIVLIGKFAMSAKIRKKERQLVLNELDVELTMVDKYIADAEEKKDYKRLRELLMIKKKLQAQESRLRYKIKLEWDEKDVKPLGDNDKE